MIVAPLTQSVNRPALATAPPRHAQVPLSVLLARRRSQKVGCFQDIEARSDSEGGNGMTSLVALVILGAAVGSEHAAESAGAGAVGARWTVERANAWYAGQPWLVGCNFIPSTASNQLEMWQAETFDLETIGRELGWAAGLGMNAVRVYLHDLAWETDPEGFTARIRQYLECAHEHGIQTAFVIFDDCWNDDPKPGKQPDPKPGVHNSCWLRSPGNKAATDPGAWPRLERYVSAMLEAFGQDPRVVFWDLYNEPGNSGQGAKSLPLLEQTFRWARAAGPSQPLTAGIWHEDKAINGFLLEHVDVVTFHDYGNAGSLERQIRKLKAHGRPVVCTEWLRRTGGSEVATHLPLFQRERVGCFNWGLVSGRTQTIYPWGSKEGGPEPEIWFHDLFRQDGTPFREDEVALFRRLASQSE